MMIQLNFTTGQVAKVVVPDGVDDEYIETAIAKMTESWALSSVESAWLPVVSWAQVDNNHFPADYSFRNAWVNDNGAVAVDLPKAKEITKDRLRRERVALFAANDIAINDALLAKDDAAQALAIAERDRLRDLPALADAATTLEELKELTAEKDPADGESEISVP